MYVSQISKHLNGKILTTKRQFINWHHRMYITYSTALAILFNKFIIKKTVVWLMYLNAWDTQNNHHKSLKDREIFITFVWKSTRGNGHLYCAYRMKWRIERVTSAASNISNISFSLFSLNFDLKFEITENEKRETGGIMFTY